MPGEGNGTLLVFTWGDPYSWRPARYRLIDLLGIYGRRNEYPGETYSSTTTLVPLVRYFAEGSSALILSLDTVAFNTEVRNGFEHEKELEDKFYEHLGGEEGPAYTDVLEYSRYCIRYYIERRLDPRLLDKVDIDVLPGVGVFKGKRAEAVYRDRPVNYYVLSYISMLRKLLDVEPHIIVLDITHGINFMPVLTYRALLSAARTYVLMNNVSDITIYVVNSDPYPLAFKGGGHKIVEPVLNINLIRKIAITRREAYWRITRELLTRKISKRMLNPVGGKHVIERGVEETYRMYLDLCRATKKLIFSYDYGLVLPLLYIQREIKDSAADREIFRSYSRHLLHDIIGVFRRGKHVERAGQSYTVEGLLEITENVESSLYAIALLKHVEELNPDTITLGGNVFYNIGSIQEIASNVGNILAEYEVNSITYWIENNRDKVDTDKPKTLLELGYGIKPPCKKEDEDTADQSKSIKKSKDRGGEDEQRRNFLAHAGFEKSLTYIVCRNGRHYIGYTKDTYGRAMEIVDYLVREIWKNM